VSGPPRPPPGSPAPSSPAPPKDAAPANPPEQDSYELSPAEKVREGKYAALKGLPEERPSGDWASQVDRSSSAGFRWISPGIQRRIGSRPDACVLVVLARERNLDRKTAVSGWSLVRFPLPALKGIKISKGQMSLLQLRRQETLPKWNYTLNPQPLAQARSTSTPLPRREATMDAHWRA